MTDVFKGALAGLELPVNKGTWDAQRVTSKAYNARYKDNEEFWIGNAGLST